MTGLKGRMLRCACALVACLAAGAHAATAQADAGSPAGAERATDGDAGNLIVVLRETRGENQQQESLQPFGAVRATMPDGRKVDIDVGWFHYVGDMHLRLVYDAGQNLESASNADLARMQLSPDEAVQLAVSNLRRLHGTPRVVAWSGRLMQVQGDAEDFDSSYFLDREFWQRLGSEHPEGLVAAVPRRGGLVFASASDEVALQQLRFSVAAIYAGAHGARVSSALYLFKNGRWSVFEPPLPSEGPQ